MWHEQDGHVQKASNVAELKQFCGQNFSTLMLKKTHLPLHGCISTVVSSTAFLNMLTLLNNCSHALTDHMHHRYVPF